MGKKTQFMSREELNATLLLVKSQVQGADQVLWENYRRFIHRKARKRVLEGSKIPVEDFVQAGFIALMNTAQGFDTTQEDYTFLSALDFSIKTEFAKESGTRSSKRDASMYAFSGDAPLDKSGEEDFNFFSTLADEQGETPFISMEQEDFQVYCRALLLEALHTLPGHEGEMVRLFYLEGNKQADIAELFGKSRSWVGALIERALYRLADGECALRLKEALATFWEFEALEVTARGGGIKNYIRTGSSGVEAMVLLNS